MRLRSVPKHAFILCFGFQVAAARILQSLPDDTYAFPKYRVTFLNGLPVLRETAERWLQDGLRGGEPEFLNEPWTGGNTRAPSLPKGIGSGDGEEDEPSSTKTSNVTLEYMKLGPDDAYICLIPPPLESPTPALEEEEEVTPVQSWSLLQPLSDHCLYHRQSWFTYSYCHNHEIRQFREQPQVQPNPSGGYEPVEDPEWESYTLGRAPPVLEQGVDQTIAQQNALAANLELARGAGSRYLVQRWGDGTMCDKTGKRREVEVQFHCSMTVTDSILLVREAKTCSYVLVIHTPRLCGQPGFKSRLETGDQAHIRCREIVNSIDATTQTEGSLTESDHPLNKVTARKPLLTVPAQRPPPADPKATVGADKIQVSNDRLLKVFKAIFNQKDGSGEPVDDALDERALNGQHTDPAGDAHQWLLDMLQATWLDVSGGKNLEMSKEDEDKGTNDDDAGQPQGRDEL